MRNALIAASLLLAMPLPALAADHVDATNGFRVNVPDGWEKFQPQNAPTIDLVLRSPRNETTGALCPLSGGDLAATKSMTQEQINAEFQDKFGADFWRGAFANMPGLTVEIENSSNELRNGRRVYLVAMRMTGKVDGADKTARVRGSMTLVPGQIALASCSAWIDHAASEDAPISQVLASFEPVTIQVIAQRPQAPATLTLFAGGRFDGPALRLTEDVVRAGWTQPVASYALAGAGLWQVCDGANFTGRCAVLAGAASLKDRPLRVASARRVPAGNDLRTVLGLAVEGFTAHRETLGARFAPRR